MTETKYLTTYYRIIHNRQINDLRYDIYSEIHHIIPKSLGGTDDKCNLVRLSAKEHYIVHHLLWRHYRSLGDAEKTYKMANAFWSMCIQHKGNRYLNSNGYHTIRKEIAKNNSKRYIGKDNPNYGNGDKIKGEKNPMFGVRRSDDWKKTHSKLLRESGKYKKEKNSTSKEYYVIDTINDTKTFIKKGYLIDYCNENDIKYTTLYVTEKRGTPISRGKGKGLLLKEYNGL